MTEKSTDAGHVTLYGDRNLRKIFLVCLVLVIGIPYNYYHDLNGLITSFSPFGAPPIVGWILSSAIFIVALILTFQLPPLIIHPRVVTVHDNGLSLKGLDRVVQWDDIQKIWFGNFDGRQFLTRWGYAFLFVEVRRTVLMHRAKFPSFGIFRTRIVKTSTTIQIRYWVPFLSPWEQKAFLRAVCDFAPHLMDEINTP